MASKHKIAFYIGLAKHRSVIESCSIDNGNPGVGGTQYLFILTVKSLNKLYSKGYAELLSDIDIRIDDDISLKNVADERGALMYCKNNDIEHIVFNANVADRFDSSFFDTDRKIILWAHNTLNLKRQRIAARTESIYRVVCVSESQYNNMSDTECFPKCTYINNIIPKCFYDNAPQSDHSEKKAVYVGSAMPQKGIHNLIEIWREVEKHSPDAELYVIGGAAVWDPELKNGRLGVGDVYYDRVIIRKLKKLRHPGNVHFLGAKGWEEIKDIISTFRVGVVNPSHYMRDETFCLSAVEMELHGLPVVSRQRNDGLNTTIVHEVNGYLEKTNRMIADKLQLLLNDKSTSEKMGRKARESACVFKAENEVYKWVQMITRDSVRSQSRRNHGVSRDSLLLAHDYILKLIYTVISGKWLKFIKR